MATFEALVVQNRSVRRFREERRVEPQTLAALVDLARRAASAGNRQPLRYLAFADTADCARIFPHLRWAALLKDWSGPAAGERPAAYILVLARTADGGMPQCDAGIAMQTLLLAAAERGLAGCMLGAIDRQKLVAACELPAGHDLLYVVALGQSAETCVLEDARDGNIGYYRDAAGVHHVPKRPLAEVLVRGAARCAVLALGLSAALLTAGCRTADDHFYWPWEEPPQIDTARQQLALQQAQREAAASRNQMDGLVQSLHTLEVRLDRLEAASADNARMRADLAAMRRDLDQAHAERDALRKEIVDDLSDRIAKYMATISAGSRTGTPTLKQSGYSHKVEAGQSLVDIAKAYKTTVSAIRKANNLKDDKIRPGMTLFIPDTSAAP